MNITTRVKNSWVELTIEDGNLIINYNIWRNDLVEIKEMLENAIDDINYMIELDKGGNNEQ
jgi:hypothetical protein